MVSKQRANAPPNQIPQLQFNPTYSLIEKGTIKTKPNTSSIQMPPIGRFAPSHSYIQSAAVTLRQGRITIIIVVRSCLHDMPLFSQHTYSLSHTLGLPLSHCTLYCAPPHCITVVDIVFFYIATPCKINVKGWQIGCSYVSHLFCVSVGLSEYQSICG